MWHEFKAKIKEVFSKAVHRGESGQGTSEYAILIGVISILAVVGVLAFGDQLGTLLDSANRHMQTVNDWSHTTS